MRKNKKDYLFHSIIYQSIICIILFFSLYGLKASNSSVYDLLKNDFYSNIKENYLTEELITNKNISNTTSNKENEKANSKNVKSNSENNTTNNEENSKTTKVPKNENIAKEKELSAEVKGIGGKDYLIDNKEDIPENVSVNNYSVNQNMIKPVNGKITSEFGIRKHPLTGTLRFHAGIDIAAKTGTPIYSSYDGKVTESGYDSWNGYYLKIEHDNDIMTVYCHCSKLNVKKGDTVKAGQVIAEVGSTGSSTGPHLHYEFRINNISYDPEIALETAINAI